MGATNSTLNYQLSQFVATDKPAWLQDYNGDMEKIDVGINTAKVAADTAQNTANSAVSSIGTVTSDISSLQTDVLAHTNDITDLQGDVNTIESLIGNGTPTAGDHTLIGAINTNTSDINSIGTLLGFNAVHIGSYGNSANAVDVSEYDLLGFMLVTDINGNNRCSAATIVPKSMVLDILNTRNATRFDILGANGVAGEITAASNTSITVLTSNTDARLHVYGLM